MPIAIKFYRLVRWNREAALAIRAWHDTDPYVERLVAIGNSLAQASSTADRQRLKAEVHQIDGSLTDLERAFAEDLNNGMRVLANTLAMAQTIIALTLISLAGFVSSRFMAARNRATITTRESAHVYKCFTTGNSLLHSLGIGRRDTAISGMRLP